MRIVALDRIAERNTGHGCRRRLRWLEWSFQEQVRGRFQMLFDRFGREVETLINEAHVVAA
jgi:hypothetical protein